MNESRNKLPFFQIIRLMFKMMLLSSEIKIPVLFLFYLATIVISLFSVYEYLKHGLQSVPLQSLLTLWFLVLFSYFWEALFAIQKQNKVEKKHERRSEEK